MYALKPFHRHDVAPALAALDTYTEHARRKTLTAMHVVFALKRQGRTLYGFGGPNGSWSRKRTGEEAERERVEKEARRLAFQAHVRGQRIPPNSAHREEARQRVGRQGSFEIQFQGMAVKAVPVGSVFTYEEGRGGYRLARGGQLYDRVMGVEEGLCDVGTGVSIRQSLKPSEEGGGLVYQAGCKLLVATEGDVVKGVGIVCTYEIGEGLIEPRGFGTPVDAFAREQNGTPILMLSLSAREGRRPLPARTRTTSPQRG